MWVMAAAALLVPLGLRGASPAEGGANLVKEMQAADAAAARAWAEDDRLPASQQDEYLDKSLEYLQPWLDGKARPE